MFKRLFSLALMTLLLAVGTIQAQMPQPQELPLNPKVRHGVLPNGLNYYLMHNEEPKNRANFYIAQKVGSTLETSEQLGLAHFLEHMAFNGTKNYPGKNMLNYLQSKGLRFGEDINAYTAFDETVYNINNVNTTDPNLMDSVLLVLHDWSGSILLAEDEINAERKVIQEEWRMRNNAQIRFYTALIKNIYSEPQYQQMPIGTMDVVMNFPPQAIRDYYAKWYRPDQQGIVIVGDFDVDAMEKKVVDLLSKIPMPENAAERVYPTVSDNQEPIFFSFEDPETTNGIIFVDFKYDLIPFQFRNTDTAYAIDLFRSIISKMINNRLSEYSNNPDCAYAQAFVNFGTFFVSKTKGAFDVTIIAKEGKTQESINEAMQIVARACKAGFSEAELDRVKSSMLANYEQMYEERDKTDNEILARDIIRHFVDNESNMGIEAEYEAIQAILPQVNVPMLNQMAAQLLTPQNQVVAIQQPQAGSWSLPAKDEVITNLENTLNAEYEAYQEEKITEPLIAKLPAKGKISKKAEGNFGTTEYTLSNGVKVVLKPTYFAANEILMCVTRKGGKEAYPTTQAANLDVMNVAFETNKIGPFDVNTLVKYLAGKKVALSYSMDNSTNSLIGSSTIKDFPTLMELLYAAMTNSSMDDNTYQATINQYVAYLGNQEKTAQFNFRKAVNETRYANNPMTAVSTVQTLQSASYPEIDKLLKATFANAADYTIYFIGNIDKVENLDDLLCQYVASLPSKGKAKAPAVVTEINTVNGQVVNEFTFPMDTPSTMILLDFNGSNLAPTIENGVKVELAGNILSNIFTQTLREEEGGAYSPYAYGRMSYTNGKWHIIGSIQTNAEQQEAMIKRAKAEFEKMLKDGVSAEDFQKVKEAALNQYEQNVKTNNYWFENLRSSFLGFDLITNHKAAIQNLTLEDYNNFLKGLYNGKDFIEVVMTGVPVEK